MTAMLTRTPASLQAVGHDNEPEPEHGSKEPLPTRYPGHPQQHADQAQPPGDEGDFDALRVIIRRCQPPLNSQSQSRFAPQHGARMGNCNACGESNESGACNRCGAPVGRHAAPSAPDGTRHTDVQAAGGDETDEEKQLNRDTEDPAPDWPL